MAELRDNTGIWFPLIRGRKSGDIVFRARFLPPTQTMRMIGDEMVSSVRGSIKHKLVAVVTRSQNSVALPVLVTHAFPNGTYRYGILKRKSPDGNDLAPLSDATLRHRDWKEIGRGASFILRETSTKIYYGLKVKSVQVIRGLASVKIGWDGENEKIVQKHETGFTTTNEWFGSLPKKRMKVPARPVVGIQEEARRNIMDFLMRAIHGFNG